MSGDSARTKVIVQQVGVMFVVSSLLCLVWYYLILSAWQSYHTAVGFYSLLAYLSITCSGAVSVQFGFGTNHHQSILHYPLLYSAIINTGRAVRVLFDTDIVGAMSSVPVLVSDLFYLATFGVLLLTASVVRLRKEPIQHGVLVVITLVFCSLLIHGLFYYLVAMKAAAPFLYAIGVGLALTAAASISVAGVLWSRLTPVLRVYDLRWMIVGFTLFGVSWFPTVTALFFPSIVWSFGFILRAVGLFILNLGIATPFMMKSGMKSRRAYAYVSVGSMLAFVPVFFTVLAEVYAQGLAYISMETYYVVHVGAAIMSGVMAFLVFAYYQQKPAMNRLPLIWLYVAWSVMQVFLVIDAAANAGGPFSESLVPYVIGGLLSLVLLPLAAKWTSRPPVVGATSVSRRPVVIAVFLVVLTSMLGLVIEDILESSFSGLAGSPVGTAILLSVNVFVIFAFIYLALALAADSHGRISADVLSVGFLSVWIIPSILKANYPDWTAGWWAAELFPLLALLFGPAFLGLLYSRELVRAEESQRKATLFADLLVHDVSNYHQSILVCLNLLEMGNLPPELREQTLQDASSELMRADHLIKNVRRLGMVEHLSATSFVPIDIVQSVRDSYQTMERMPAARGFEFHVNREIGECFVLANALLADVFLNLFHNSVKYAKGERVIDVNIRPIAKSGSAWWEIRVADHSSGIEPELKARLFERYMDGAHGRGLGLSVASALVKAFGGTISMEDRVRGDYTKGTVFVIALPAAEGPSEESSPADV